MYQYAAIVPAYNEEGAIAQVVTDLNKFAKSNQINLQVIVVNDCSKDNTGNIIDQLPCVALHLPVNLGIGGAVQTGFKYAYRNGFDFAFQVDGDGQHPPEEMIHLLNGQQQHQSNVTIGSRFITGEGFQSSFMRKVGIRYFQFLLQALTGFKITDSTSGFRMLDRKALELVCNYYPDEYPEPEAIVLYARNQLKVTEVPVKMKDRESGNSSIGFFASLYYMAKVSLAILFSYIRIK